jgi:glycosyltransferase involved in cell wall biosynthesis
MLDVSVVIPVRNAEEQLDECLASIMRCEPREIIVVDGNSTDRTLSIARKYPVRILSDEGRGLPVARLLGAEAAGSRWVALIDADVVVPEGALELLLTEFVEGGYTALQAGLSSVGGPGYWGRALANHHRTGRSKDWFGLVATIFEREALLEIGFDPTFGSGEDIEVRWRLAQTGARVGVSEQTFVTHRFGDTFEFARGQWDADGRGLARMIRKHRLRGTMLLGLPLAAGIRGIALSLVRRQPSWTLYYACFTVFNYVAMLAELGRRPNEERTLLSARGLGR